MPTTPDASPRRGASIWVGMLVLYVVWGSTYLGIAVAVDTIPPFLMAATRFGIAGASPAWLVARPGSRRLVRSDATRVARLAIVGGLLLGGGMGMVAFGELTIPSGIAALLIALMPVWVAIFGRLFLGERLPRIAVVGIAVGLRRRGDPRRAVGLRWHRGARSARPRRGAPLPDLLDARARCSPRTEPSCRASPCWRRVPRCSPGRCPGRHGRGSAANSATLRLEAVSAESLAALAYLTIVGSLLAFTTYGWLLRVAPLPLIATYAYVNPVVAVALGALVLREPIEPRTLLAGAIIVFAVALIVTTRSRMSSPRRSLAPDAAPAAASPVSSA